MMSNIKETDMMGGGIKEIEKDMFAWHHRAPNEEEYKRFLMDNIIAEGMGNIYGSAYQDIVLIEGDLQKRRAERRKGYQSKVTSQG